MPEAKKEDVKQEEAKERIEKLRVAFKEKGELFFRRIEEKTTIKYSKSSNSIIVPSWIDGLINSRANLADSFNCLSELMTVSK